MENALQNLNTASFLKIAVTEDAQTLEMLCARIRTPQFRYNGQETLIPTR